MFEKDIEKIDNDIVKNRNRNNFQNLWVRYRYPIYNRLAINQKSNIILWELQYFCKREIAQWKKVLRGFSHGENLLRGFGFWSTSKPQKSKPFLEILFWPSTTGTFRESKPKPSKKKKFWFNFLVFYFIGPNTGLWPKTRLILQKYFVFRPK